MEYLNNPNILRVFTIMVIALTLQFSVVWGLAAIEYKKLEKNNNQLINWEKRLIELRDFWKKLTIICSIYSTMLLISLTNSSLVMEIFGTTTLISWILYLYSSNNYQKLDAPKEIMNDGYTREPLTPVGRWITSYRNLWMLLAITLFSLIIWKGLFHLIF